MNILITGGAGFFGYHLAKFLSQNNEIYIIDNFSMGKLDDDFVKLISKKNVHFFEKDLKKSLKELLKENFKYIFHCGAACGTKLFYEKPYYTLSNNLLSTINLINSLKNFKGKIIFTSSSETYAGNNEIQIPTPEVTEVSIPDVYNPRWSYAGSKIVGEQLFIHSGLCYSIVRLHNPYGERMGYRHFFPETMRRILKKQDPFEIFGGEETRSFCYVGDAVRAIWEVAKTDNTNNKIINIGRCQETKIKDIYKEIFELTKFNPPNIIYKDSPKGSVKRRCPNVSLLKELTGYECKTDIKEGLKRTWKWYKNEK